MTNICMEELNNDVCSVQSGHSELNKKIHLLSDYDKQQYTNYYQHKIKLLNLFRKHESSIIRTSSFYCDVCDYITEEKYFWDKHNKTEHLDVDTRRTIYCSTCKMLIAGKNNEKHFNTAEHYTFFKFLQSLECVEESMVKKTTLEETVNFNQLACKPNVDMKIQKTIEYVDVSTSTNDIYLIDSV